MNRIFTGLVALPMLIIGFATAAVADDADILRQAQDRADIEALMWRYTRALDGFNADEYAAVFTEDGQFGSGANATKGRQALHDMVQGLADGRNESSQPMYHMTMNHHIEFVGSNRARLHAYWQTVFGAAGDAPLRIAAAGRSVDELVKIDGQWLIESRNVAPED